MATRGKSNHTSSGANGDNTAPPNADPPAINNRATTTPTTVPVPRKMPVGRKFQKGVSGNPSGRPKRDAHIAELARTHTKAAIATLAEIMKNQKASHSARIAAATALIDRGYGRAPQSVAWELGLGNSIESIKLEFVAAPEVDDDDEIEANGLHDHRQGVLHTNGRSGPH